MSTTSVLDGVSGIDAARLIELWRRYLNDDSRAFGDGFDEYADDHLVPAVARAECKRIAREVLS